jgi:tetratricopeptide (TPR) repeat protein
MDSGTLEYVPEALKAQIAEVLDWFEKEVDTEQDEDFEKAIKYYSRAIELSPSGQMPVEGAYYCNRGLLYQDRGQPD